MAKFLIEVPHEGSMEACIRTVELFHQTGSHFLTHADWGCRDGEHTAWMVVDVDTRDEARNVVPPMFRARARVVQLNAFTPQDIEGLRRSHEQ
jgi:hypothetical protein